MAEALREELGRLLLLGVKDPRVQGVVVTAVKLTDDLREARVYFVVEGDGTADRLAEVQEGLEKVKGFLRREVGKAIRARTTPDLHFHFDESIGRGAHIERLLDEIRRER
jgi:ribosome-binding factor A